MVLLKDVSIRSHNVSFSCAPNLIPKKPECFFFHILLFQPHFFDSLPMKTEVLRVKIFILLLTKPGRQLVLLVKVF